MDYAEFGKYLAQQRELRGMSREDVSTKTKIPKSVLMALEMGEKERLPERIFVLNYVRAYATVIGLSPEDAVLRFEEIYTGGHTLVSPVEQERRRRNRAWVVLAGIVLLIVGAIGAFVWLNQQPPR